MTDKRTILNLIPGQQYELRSPRGIRVSYPLGKPRSGDPLAVLTRDIGVWVEPEPPPVEPPPVEPPPLPANAYYLAPSGSDSAAGTQAAPWRSLAKFYGQAKPGDTLLVRGGTYNLPPVVDLLGKASGTAAAPITVRAYPGEVPNFVSQAMYFDGGVSYHVLDGITISGPISGSSCHIWIGNGKSVPGTALTHHITIRNCTITKGGGAVTAHGIYLSHKCDQITIEGCTITGYGPSLPQDRCAGIHIYHDPQPPVVLIQRNIFRNWPKGIITYADGTPTVTGSFLHNTFDNNDFHFDARHHQAITVRDNVGGKRITADLYDPNYASKTTADHNYWGQTLNADGSLQAGSPAIGGASDGSNAGAL